VTEETRAATSRIGCGNAVVLDHGAGWTTVYCHMMEGSLLVSDGARVRAGDPLGFVGLSGLTEFPHLEFQVRHRGVLRDPTAEGLWEDDGPVRDAYGPVILHVGFATTAPRTDRIIAGDHEPATLDRESGDFLFYATILGAAPGQNVGFTLTGPDGTTLAEDIVAVDRPQILRTNWIGLRDIRRLEPGSYRGTVTLTDADGNRLERSTEVRLTP